MWEKLSQTGRAGRVPVHREPADHHVCPLEVGGGELHLCRGESLLEQPICPADGTYHCSDHRDGWPAHSPDASGFLLLHQLTNHREWQRQTTLLATCFPLVTPARAGFIP